MNELRLEIQRYAFAAYDMRLYLDTHPGDARAFAIFRTLTETAEKLMDEFESKYGPLDAAASACDESDMWLNSPWPWEKGGNA